MSPTTAFSILVPPFPAPLRNVGVPLAVIIGLGTLAALILSLLTAVNPAGTLLGFTLATTAMALVLACYLWLDRWEPEPPRLLVLAFLWGSSVAVLLSILLEMLIDSSLPAPATGAGPTTGFATVAVAAPIIEEAAKGLFLLVMMTGRRRAELNTLTDCLVYAGLTGAGFAWLENIVYIANGEGVAASLAVAGLRLILGPFAHPLFTTMFGIGVYVALQQRAPSAKVFAVVTGYAAAVLLHALWNGSALIGAGTYLGVYLVWMMPIFALAVTLAIISRRRERHIIAAQLAPMVAVGLVTPSEAGWLGSLRTRRQAVSMARLNDGRRAGAAVKRFVQGVVELAYARDRIDRGFGDARLVALQHEEVARIAAARLEAGPALYRLAGYPPPRA